MPGFVRLSGRPDHLRQISYRVIDKACLLPQRILYLGELAQCVVGIGIGSPERIGLTGHISPDIISKCTGSALRILRRYHPVQTVIGIGCSLSQAITFLHDVICKIVLEEGLIAERRLNTLKPSRLIITIAVASLIGHRQLCHLIIQVHFIAGSIALRISFGQQIAMLIIGIRRNLPLGGNLFGQIAKPVIAVFKNQFFRVFVLDQPAECIVTVFLYRLCRGCFFDEPV